MVRGRVCRSIFPRGARRFLRRSDLTTCPSPGSRFAGERGEAKARSSPAWTAKVETSQLLQKRFCLSCNRSKLQELPRGNRNVFYSLAYVHHALQNPTSRRTARADRGA